MTDPSVTQPVSGNPEFDAAVKAYLDALYTVGAQVSDLTGQPDRADVRAYIGDSSRTDDELDQALTAERAAQATRCRMPYPGAPWPADLAEALLRRVAANLANRALPLGVQSSLSEVGASTVRVGGLDREVRRLEAPHRRVTIR